MNAYLLIACVSQVDPHTGMLRDWCVSMIIYDANETEARAWFESSVVRTYTNELAGPPRIEKIVSAPVVSDLITESGVVPIQWPQLVEEVFASAQAMEGLLHELGYWVDCNQAVSPRNLSPDAEALRNHLPADIRDSVNWEADRCSYFLVSSLKFPPAPPSQAELDAAAEEIGDDRESEDDDSLVTSRQMPAFPELAEKELVGVVKARNSVVAAWLWRRHLQATPLAGNPIRIDGWPGVEKRGESVE